MAQIRDFYRQFSDARGSNTVNLQGIVFNTNDGGRLPLEQYLAATLAERDALLNGSRTIAAVARDRKLNARYLGILWRNLTSREPSLLLDGVRARWRTTRPDEAAALAARIAAWQKALWRFRTVGHIGKVGGPRRWLEPVDPLISREDVRFKIPPATESQDVVLSLRRLGRRRRQRARLRRLATAATRGSRPTRLAVARRPRRHAGIIDEARAGLRPRRAVISIAADEAAADRGQPDVATPGQEARHRAGRLPRLARLPGHRLRRRGTTAGSSAEAGQERVVPVHQRLGLPRAARVARQLVRSGRPRSGQHEAARRGGPSLADAPRGRRVAQPGDRLVPRRALP